MTDEIERSNAVVIARDSFSIDDAGARAQAGQRFDDQRETMCKVIAGTAVEPNAWSVLAGNDPRPDKQNRVMPRAKSAKRF
jgi:hypothetical protein